MTAKGGEILEYLLKNHENKQDYRTHLFVFERNFNQIKNKHPGSECHDFTSDLRNWMSLTTSDMETVISNLEENCVVVIDSLVHVLYRYGLLGAYQTFTDIKNKKSKLYSEFCVVGNCGDFRCSTDYYSVAYRFVRRSG